MKLRFTVDRVCSSTVFKRFAFPTQGKFSFRSFHAVTSSVSTHSIKKSTFVTEMLYVFCEQETEYLSTIQMEREEMYARLWWGKSEAES